MELYTEQKGRMGDTVERSDGKKLGKEVEAMERVKHRELVNTESLNLNGKCVNIFLIVNKTHNTKTINVLILLTCPCI